MANSTTTPSALRIAFWNANGLLKDLQEVRIFTNTHNLDILLINETHLNPSNTPKIANYTLYRNDRLHSRGGGTAIFVKSKIAHKHNITPALSTIESTSITIFTKHSGPLRINSIYNPPQKKLQNSDLELLLDGQTPTILAGDFNAKHASWNSKRANTNGRILHKYIKNHTDLIADGPMSPTHFPARGHPPDVLDIALFYKSSWTYCIETINDLSSDHNPVLLTVNELSDPPPSKSRKKTDWTYFSHRVGEKLSINYSIKNAKELDSAVDNFAETIMSSINESSKTLPERTPFNLKGDLPKFVKELIATKNKLRRHWQKNQIRRVKTTVNRIQALIRKKLIEHSNSNWNKKLQEINPQDGSLWKLSKALRSTPTPNHPIHAENGIVYDDQDKAEAFAASLEKQFSPSFKHADLDHIANVNRKVNSILNSLSPNNIHFTTPAEVIRALKYRKNKTAPGPDGITNFALKALPQKGILALVNLINSALRLRYFPKSWKHAHVIVLPKQGKDPLFCENHRPISLLSNIGKIYERILLTRLLKHIDEVSTLPDEQHGFRSRHSTLHQLLRVSEIIIGGFNSFRSTGAIFLDIAKAFDKVWSNGLLLKLHDTGIDPQLLGVFKSFLRRRTFQVKYRGALSKTHFMTAGVPQGSLLSPTLFNVYTHDIPLNENQHSYKALYADDTTVMVQYSSPKMITHRLQANINRLQDWYDKWRIDVNPAKSVAVLFSRSKNRKSASGVVTMYDQVIPWQNTAKYLGVTLDKRLTWIPHIKNTLAKARKVSGALNPLLQKYSKTPIHNKLLIYKTQIRPVITYASPIWGTANTKRLETFQNVMLRRCTKSPWFVRNTIINTGTKIPPLKTHIVDLAKSFYSKLASNPNPSIACLGQLRPDENPTFPYPISILLPP